ncbi:MAG: hypothetical protein Q7J27_08070 [Syntrophales bacterium]|nr:hypothetical protein [Syntrophales bacterium]
MRHRGTKAQRNIAAGGMDKLRALHNTNIVIASEAKQSDNILIIHKIAASLKLLAMTRIAVLQSSQTMCRTLIRYCLSV